MSLYSLKSRLCYWKHRVIHISAPSISSNYTSSSMSRRKKGVFIIRTIKTSGQTDRELGLEVIDNPSQKFGFLVSLTLKWVLHFWSVSFEREAESEYSSNR